MNQVGVRELRQNLSVYLRRVTDEGETLEVTDRGRPVAILAPLPVPGDGLARLEAMGLLSRRATADHRDLPAPLPPTGGPTLGELLQADRDA